MDIQKTYGIFNKSAQKAEELRETKWAQFFETPCSLIVQFTFSYTDLQVNVFSESA